MTEYALTLGVRHAWELAPAVTSVWLHTSSAGPVAGAPQAVRISATGSSSLFVSGRSEPARNSLKSS